MIRNLLALTLCLLATGCGKVDWKGLNSEEGRFSALFPGEPKREYKEGKWFAVTAFSVKHAGATYEVSYRTAKESLSLDTFKEYWQRHNYTVTAVNEWSIDGLKGREVETKSNEHANVYYSGRVILVGDRSYEAKVFGDDARLANPNVRTFLQSFAPWKKRD